MTEGAEGLPLFGTINPEQPNLLRLALVHDADGVTIDHTDYLPDELRMYEARA